MTSTESRRTTVAALQSVAADRWLLREIMRESVPEAASCSAPELARLIPEDIAIGTEMIGEDGGFDGRRAVLVSVWLSLDLRDAPAPVLASVHYLLQHGLRLPYPLESRVMID